MGRTTHPTLGYLGVAGIWVTAGLALPFVNYLRAFSPEQLMTVRGLVTAALAFALLRSVPWRVDRHTRLMALVLPLATLGLFEGIRAWGAGPTLIVLTATPLVNIALSPLLGRTVSRASIIGLALVLVGVVVARWGGHFNWAGLGWSVFATVMNGLLYELLTRAKAGPLEKSFWGFMGMGLLGLALSFIDPWRIAAEPDVLALLVGFAFVGGFLYSIANLLAFKYLPTNEASVLAQGETPAVIIGAYFLLGEHLTWVQWIGVGIAFSGAWYLSVWLRKATKKL